jgi:hypothetical protein
MKLVALGIAVVVSAAMTVAALLFCLYLIRVLPLHIPGATEYDVTPIVRSK